MKAWSWLMRACGAGAGLTVGASMLLVCYDVIARNLGALSLPWIVEVTEYSLPLATLLAAPWLLHRFEHIRLDLLEQVLPAALKRHVDRIAALVVLLVSVTFVWYSIAVIRDSREIGALVMKSLVFPEWWLFVPVPVCFALLAGEAARRLFAADPGAGVHTIAPGEDA